MSNRKYKYKNNIIEKDKEKDKSIINNNNNNNNNILSKLPSTLSNYYSHTSEIINILSTYPININKLRELSIYGYINNKYRTIIWSILLNVTLKDNTTNINKMPNIIIKNNNNYIEQINKDILRSYNHFDISYNWSRNSKIFIRKITENMLNNVFNNHNDLHYIQGFHDVAGIFYLVTKGKVGSLLLEAISLQHFKDVLSKSLDPVMTALSYFYIIINHFEPEIYKILTDNDVPPFFAISWCITWFAHDVSKVVTIVRIYDFLIASPPIMSLYLSAALVIHVKSDLMELVKKDDSDVGVIHAFFRNITLDKVHIETLLFHCLDLFQRLPPKKLFSMPSTSKISSTFAITSAQQLTAKYLNETGTIPKKPNKAFFSFKIIFIASFVFVIIYALLFNYAK